MYCIIKNRKNQEPLLNDSKHRPSGNSVDADTDGFFSFHPAENTNKKTEKAIDLPPFCLYNGR